MTDIEWKPTKLENPEFRCWKCDSNEIRYKIVESSCGGYDDYKYRCTNCDNEWWAESADA